MNPNPLYSRRAWLATALLAPWAVSHARPLNLPLAMHTDSVPDPAGYLVSEKYDGVRALWDGQQLRFRSGLPVAAPGWFMAALPPTPLDGELWLARGQFEALSGLVRRQRPDDTGWRQLRYLVFDLPAAEGRFVQRHLQLLALAQASAAAQPWQPVAQQAFASRAELARHLAAGVAQGGEGLMLRRADAPYLHGRGPDMLKLKPLQDAEATVLAHVPGRGKHAGRLGALWVQTDTGQRFKLGTGFSDAQRLAPPAVGQRVTYSHRGVTEAGLPRFASFVRERPAGL